MTEEEVEVRGETYYRSRKSDVAHSKLKEKLKKFMIDNGIVKLDIALVPKAIR